MSIEKLFTLLKDGAWHGITELADQTGTETNKLIEYSQFLAGQGIAKYEDKTQRIKIEPEWSRLLPDLSQLSEPKTTMATFIIPPETSINVQSTSITNNSKIELEVTLRINNRIREIAITL